MQRDVAVSAPQAAMYCGVSASTVRRWIRGKDLAAYKTSKSSRVRIRLRDLDSFAARHRIVVNRRALRLQTVLGPAARVAEERALMRPAVPQTAPAPETQPFESRLVVFSLASTQYAVGVSAVQGIITMAPITEVPGTPEFVDGVMNLRNAVVPVINLRRRLGHPRLGANKDSRMIVVAVGEAEAGLVVDRVSEVVCVQGESFARSSSIGPSADSVFVQGLIKVDDCLVTVLDLPTVLGLKRQVAKEESQWVRPEETGGLELPKIAESDGAAEHEKTRLSEPLGERIDLPPRRPRLLVAA